jgi:hypothetical protein
MAGPADRSCMDPTHDRDTRAAADRPLHPVQVPPRPRRRPHIAAVALAVLLVAAAVSAGVSFRNGRAWERRAGQSQAVSDCRTALDDRQTLQGLIDSMPEPPGS